MESVEKALILDAVVDLVFTLIVCISANFSFPLGIAILLFVEFRWEYSL